MGNWCSIFTLFFSFLRYDSCGHFLSEIGIEFPWFRPLPRDALALSCLFSPDSLSQPPWKDPLFYLARFSPDVFFSSSCFLSCVWFPSPFQLTWSPRFYFLGLFSFRLSKEIKIFVFSIQGSLALHAHLSFGLYVCISKNHINVSCLPRFIYPSALTRVSNFWVFSPFSIIYFKWIRVLLSFFATSLAEAERHWWAEGLLFFFFLTFWVYLFIYGCAGSSFLC